MTSKRTIFLPVETRMTITPDAAATGTLYSQTQPGAERVVVSAVTASTPIVIGPLNQTMQYALELTTGTASVVKAFDGSPAPASDVAPIYSSTITEDGEIDITASDVFIVEGTGNISLTLPTPAASENGRVITIIQKDLIVGFGNLLTVTATGLLLTSAGTKNSMNFAATANSTAKLLIMNGKYISQFTYNVTFAPA